MKRALSISHLALCAALALSSVACGGGKQDQPKTPQGTRVDQPITGGPGGVYNAQGQQYGITDAPTSGEAANRPKMNASAAQAYAAGLQAFQVGDLQGAKTQFTKATEADANAYQAHYSLGVVKERLGEGGALSSYSKAVSIVSDYEPAIYAYGVLLARQGKATEASEYLQGRLAKMPKSAAVPAALAEVKSIEGDTTGAQQYARDALKKNPDYRPAMITIARDHYRRRRLDLALYSLKAVLDGFGTENPARDSNNAEARLLRGLIYKEQAKRKEAIEEFSKALQARPDLVEARVQLAAYQLEAGNAAEAAQLLEGALKYDKTNVLARLNLGDAYRLLGKSTEAKKELDWVLAKEPNMAQVHYNLGLLYLFATSLPGMTPKQQADKAITELEKYKELAPRTKGGPDDTDELITRAKTKKAIIEAEKSAPPPTAPAPAPAKGAAPAGGATKPAAPSAGGSTKSLPPAEEKKK